MLKMIINKCFVIVLDLTLFLDNDEWDDEFQNGIIAFIQRNFVYENIQCEDDENDEMQFQIAIAPVFDVDELLDIFHIDVLQIDEIDLIKDDDDELDDVVVILEQRKIDVLEIDWIDEIDEVQIIDDEVDDEVDI